MPKKSFPIPPEASQSADSTTSDSLFPKATRREQAEDFILSREFAVAVAAGALLGLGAAYGLDPDVRDAVNQLPEDLKAIVTDEISQGNIPGIGGLVNDQFLQNPDGMRSDSGFEDGDVFRSITGSDARYQGVDIYSVPISVTPGTAYTVPSGLLSAAVQVPAK
jgi:hypothetical protein